MPDQLAMHGGNPVRSSILPYGRQQIDQDDIAAVVEVLQSDWLTTGPKVSEFERVFAAFVGSTHAVAVNSGTAALHAAAYALNIGPDDEVIVPPMTFAATVNAVVFHGATPVFADVNPETLLIDPARVAEKITAKTKAIIAVDYAGQPCDYDALRHIADENSLTLIADACHALGGTYKKRPVGGLADLNTFSFHPVKHITTGEGGMITTNCPEWDRQMRSFRNHCLTSDLHKRTEENSWVYEVADLGYNYRLTDFQCALGLSQLHKLPGWITRRREIADQYNRVFNKLPAISPLWRREDVEHAYHLYVVRLNLNELKVDRATIFKALRAEGIGVNVHYIPVHLQPYYRRRFGTGPGDCPMAERVYEQIISLPIFPAMSQSDVEDVIEAVTKVIRYFLDTR